MQWRRGLGGIWDIGLDGMIGGNGSYVEDQGNGVRDIDKAPAIKALLDYLGQMPGIQLLLVTPGLIFPCWNTVRLVWRWGTEERK